MLATTGLMGQPTMAAISVWKKILGVSGGRSQEQTTPVCVRDCASVCVSVVSVVSVNRDTRHEKWLCYDVPGRTPGYLPRSDVYEDEVHLQQEVVKLAKQDPNYEVIEGKSLREVPIVVVEEEEGEDED